MNEIGLDLNAVGNHEFDEGTTELLRMQNGGCHPVDGCLDGDGFDGADFQFLAANVVNDDHRRDAVPAVLDRELRRRQGGLHRHDARGHADHRQRRPASPAASFLDEADTVNALIPDLKRRQRRGHRRAASTRAASRRRSTSTAAPAISGADRRHRRPHDHEVDLVVSGHTHQPYNCVIDGTPVTSAYSFGRLVTDIDMTVDKAHRRVTSITINNRIVTRDVTPDPDITALIDRYAAVAAPIANRPIGNITADITRHDRTTSRESALGNAIADAQLGGDATTPATARRWWRS